MQTIGLDPDSKIVVYDYKYDATRLWWAFYSYGKTDVRILDGGIKAWTRAGFPTDMVAGGKAAKPGRSLWLLSFDNLVKNEIINTIPPKEIDSLFPGRRDHERNLL